MGKKRKIKTEMVPFVEGATSERACAAKVRHPTSKAAEYGARELERRLGEALVVHHCRLCAGYHVAHPAQFSGQSGSRASRIAMKRLARYEAFVEEMQRKQREAADRRYQERMQQGEAVFGVAQ